MKVIFLAMLLCIWSIILPSNTHAEYYQYTGADGAVHFTDNLADVPRDQRNAVKSIQGIRTPPRQTGRTPSHKSNAAAAKKESAPSATPAWDARLKGTAEKLNREKKALKKMYDKLQAERRQIGEPPGIKAPVSKVQAYQDKIHALNQRIKAYKKRRAEFLKKVKAFNTMIK